MEVKRLLPAAAFYGFPVNRKPQNFFIFVLLRFHPI